jgi:hypothetical protein
MIAGERQRVATVCRVHGIARPSVIEATIPRIDLA